MSNPPPPFRSRTARITYLEPWRDQIISAVLGGKPVKQVATELYADVVERTGRNHADVERGIATVAVTMLKLLRENRIDYYTIGRQRQRDNPRQEYAAELRKRGHKLADIAARLGVSVERVRQIILKQNHIDRRAHAA